MSKKHVFSRSSSPHSRISSASSSPDEDRDNEKRIPTLKSIKSNSGKQDYFSLKLRSGPYNNRSPMGDIPILEDDESDQVDDGPILPLFSMPSSNQVKSSKIDLAGIDKQRLEAEIDDDDDDDYSEELGDDDTEGAITIPFKLTRNFSDDIEQKTKDIKSSERTRNTGNTVTGADSDSSSDESTDEETDENNKNIASEPSSSNDDNHLQKPVTQQQEPVSFASRIKRRLTINHSDAQDAANMEGIEDIGSVETSQSHNVFSRIFGFGNGGIAHNGAGGLIPGAVPSEKQLAPLDEEQRIGNDIPLSNLNPEDLKDEARGIVNQHFTFNDASSSTTLVTGNTNNNDFFEANPDIILEDFDDLRDNPDDDFELDHDSHIAARPKKFKSGIASSLLALYNPNLNQSTASYSGTQTPMSNSSLEHIMDPIALENKLKNINLGSTNISDSDLSSTLRRSQSSDNVGRQGFQHHHRTKSTQSFTSMFKADNKEKRIPGQEKVKYNLPQFSKRADVKDESAFKKRKKRFRRQKFAARITVHIADVLQREVFILKLCKAFMLYGAPTHRLEEYMTMTARVLEIDGSFIYFPGSMIVSFGDAATRTSDMKLVRCAQGVDLGKLDDCYEIYKDVVHDTIGVQEASTRLDELMNRKRLYNPYMCVLIYGFASAMVTPWGFSGSWIDMPISFGIGILVGIMQFIICPKSSLYSSVFEVSASILVSFIGRAIGSINGGKTFCFAGIVQGSLALILPGYIILCGSLELQSRNIVAGAVRMFYAIIYSLFLGFGITLGAALYGWIDHNATSETSCTSDVSPWFRFLLVPMFTIGLALINQAKFSQLPVMVLISGGGYVVSYFSSLHFSSSTEFTATLGCFVIGLLSNLYSRLFKAITGMRATGMAVSSMLPAIFVQVPSGIASQGSLLSGVTTADEIVNGTSTTTSSGTYSSSNLSFGIAMIEVALGISVGLYAATIVVYPFGKKATGLFTL